MISTSLSKAKVQKQSPKLKHILKRYKLPEATVTILDTLHIFVDRPDDALKQFNLPQSFEVVYCDIFIAGGGMGGVAAAVAATREGYHVCLTEETDWLGGQMTSQGVSALDENYLVETTGATLTYQRLRSAIRSHYQNQATSLEVPNPYLNPGNCWVSALSFEPQVALQKIMDILQPAIEAKALSIYYRVKPVAVSVHNNKIRSILAVNLDSGTWTEFRPQVCLDATELGELLPLAGTPYSVGAESQSETTEPHAPSVADKQNVQDFVYPFVVDLRRAENNTITKPQHYEDFCNQSKFSFAGYKMFKSTELVISNGQMVQLNPFWEYRRLIHKAQLPGSPFEFDLSMINWNSNDLRDMNIIDQPPAIACQRLALAKSLSLGFLYWLQTEAPRDEGGQGYGELCLRTDILGTTDGLSKYPYIRESRRIKAMKTIIEQDIAAASNPGARARLYADSVGIGLYPIDIHGREEIPGAAQATKPFQIPAGTLIPQYPYNLLASAKNIGTTHITNGSYRLHPIEWAIGEAAGTLAAQALTHKVNSAKILHNKRYTRELQYKLVEKGVPVYWYDDVPTNHPAFAAIQFLSATGIIFGDSSHLHFSPDYVITRGEAAQVLANLLHLPKPNKTILSKLHPDEVIPYGTDIAACLQKHLFSLRPDGLFHPEEELTGNELALLSRHRLVQTALPYDDASPVTRARFALWAYKLATSKKH
ncbi:MAG: FAD-dependent oxidoreductase [Candidatus Melainabacteria bacterium]|nr:FAD-dependent oxidoreductase [Candidatus Melainabacteria bacterium]